MRTTLNIDDDLYRSIKIEAVRRGVSMTSLVEEALRAVLVEKSPPPLRELPVSSRTGGVHPGVNLMDSQQWYDLLYGQDSQDTSFYAGLGRTSARDESSRNES